MRNLSRELFLKNNINSNFQIQMALKLLLKILMGFIF